MKLRTDVGTNEFQNIKPEFEMGAERSLAWRRLLARARLFLPEVAQDGAVFDFQPLDLIVNYPIAASVAIAARLRASAVLMRDDTVPATAEEESFHA